MILLALRIVEKCRRRKILIKKTASAVFLIIAECRVRVTGLGIFEQIKDNNSEKVLVVLFK